MGVLTVCLLFGAGWRATDLSVVSSAGDRLATYRTAISAVVHSDARRMLLAQPLQSAHDYYASTLSALPQLPSGATVDVMPWDVGMIYEDSRLHWDPRPAMQSYLAYTSWLDQLDAAFLRSAAARRSTSSTATSPSTTATPPSTSRRPSVFCSTTTAW